MVKITGPMMSLDAQGTLGDAITFAKWKGRPYVRQRVIPSNPKTGAQLGRRAMFKFLTKEWDPFPDNWKATWQEDADELVTSPFNAFMAENMLRWHNFLPPGVLIPITNTGTIGTWYSVPVAAWVQNQIRFNCKLDALNDNWGLAIFASPTGTFNTAVGNAILILRLRDTGEQKFYWTPPQVQTWYFDTRLFTLDGLLGAEQGEIWATPP